MNQYNDIKCRVRSLRSEGKTYSEIKKLLSAKIPKSTLSTWCFDVELPVWYKEKIGHLNNQNLNKAQKMAWISNKLKQEKRLESLRNTNLHMIEKIKDKNILKMLLAMLYLGEGAKWQSHRGLQLGSSYPLIVKLYLRLLYLCYGITINEVRARISYRADQNLSDLKKFWSRETLIPLKNFYNSIPDPRTKGKITKHKKYKGVCSISCKSTDIQLELSIIPEILFKGM